MSLVGNLEDLSLGDILQIISLSQKSGVLSLRTGGGAGRIVFVGGLVRGAAVENGARDLKGVLLQGGFLDESGWDAATAHAGAEGTSLAAAIEATSDLTTERIDSLCREAVEAAVVTMFTWQKGDFSFDVRSEPIEGDPELLLPMGMNAQYLAMEAARMRDESNPGDDTESSLSVVSGDDTFDETTGSPATDPSAFDAMSAEEMFGVVPSASDGDPSGATHDDILPPVTGDDLITAADALARATLERVEAAFGDDAPDFMSEMGELAEPGPDDTQDFDVAPVEAPDALEPLDDLADAELIEFSEADVMAPEPIPTAAAVVDPFAVHADEKLLGEASAAPDAGVGVDAASGARPSAAATGDADSSGRPATDWRTLGARPVVVVDESLSALEWVKEHLRGRFEQVHIFQRSDQGLARIRQYLIRGAAPILLVAPDIPVDHLSGLRSPRDFVDRLKAQSPKLDAVWLVSEDAGAVDAAKRRGASLRRPSDDRMRCAVGSEELDAAGRALAERLGQILTVAAASESGGAAPRSSNATLARLRDTTRQLGDASSGGEILPLVIRFASEIFSRVAMFMVRDDVATGLGQVGLDRCGGPDDDAFRKVRLQVSATGWMRRVVETRSSVCGAPTDEGDRDLAGEIGDRVPEYAYCAPIESAGDVVALLYADNLPGGGPAGDTSALEVVLHHAGLALDRAALERALQE